METNTHKGLISAVVSCYNKAEIIEECLCSIASQEVPLQLIIVDDCSTDNSRDIIRQFADLSDIVLHSENKGVCAARNSGAEIAVGEYIIFIDGDMVLKPNILKEMKYVLDTHDDIGFVYGDYDRSGDYEKVFKNKTFKSKEFNVDELCRANYICTTSLLRREFCHLWDDRIKRLNDWDYWLTLCLKGVPGYYLARIIFTAHFKDGDISLAGDEDGLYWYRYVARKHLERIKNES